MTGIPPAPTEHIIPLRVFDAPTALGRAPLKILLLKLDHIGDFVTAINAFGVLRRAFAGAEITLMCLPAVVALAKSTRLFDRVIGFTADRDSSSIGKVPHIDVDDLQAHFVELQDGPYFLAVDMKHDVLTPFSWLDHIDTQYRAGFARTTQKGLDILLPTMEWKTPFLALGQKNLALHAETRMMLLAHLVVETLLYNPLDGEMFHAPEALETPAYENLRTTERMKIGIGLGAGSELRKWPVDYWRDLAHRLIVAHNPLLVFFGGGVDQVETQALIDVLPAENVLNLVAAMPLAHVPVTMNQLDAYIGCDTGLTHLAAGLDVPTLNIYAGISNLSVWRARGPRVKTLYAEVICAPCHLRFKKDCPNQNICMVAIKPEIAFDCFGQLVTPS